MAIAHFVAILIQYSTKKTVAISKKHTCSIFSQKFLFHVHQICYLTKNPKIHYLLLFCKRYIRVCDKQRDHFLIIYKPVFSNTALVCLLVNSLTLMIRIVLEKLPNDYLVLANSLVSFVERGASFVPETEIFVSTRKSYGILGNLHTLVYFSRTRRSSKVNVLCSRIALLN